MEGYSESENSKGSRPWTTDMMRENRENWNLGADVGVLEYLQQFGNKLLNETEKTVDLLDSFEAELNTSCVQVSNITNRFLSLADSQFVENRVYDDEETPTPDTTNKVPNDPVKTKQEIESEIFSRLKESVNNGLNVLNTKFEAVEVSNSDSEDDDSGPMGTVYKPINMFNNRPLPHLIGSVEFLKDPTVGLEELASDDEESIEEESSSESKELSEENDYSEPESDRPNNILPKDNIHNDDANDILFAPTSTSFADHLAKRLESMENESRLPKQQTRNLFSSTPPPLDDSCDDEFGSADDLIFGSNNRNDIHDGDVFAPKTKSGFQDNENLFVPKSSNSLWEDNHGDSVRDKVEPVSENDARKKVMKDLENKLSRNFKSNIADNNFYDISPSPPPLSDDLNNENVNDDEKFKNKSSSLFDDNLADNDETDDLFASSTKNIPSAANKKKVFPGSVDVFGNTADLFKDSVKHQSKNNVSKAVTNDEGNKIDSDIISKTILSIRKTYEDEDDEEEEDPIFKSSNQQDKSSSRSSSVKLSESFQDDNISIKSNKSAGLFDDVVTNSKKNSIKKTMDDLFSNLNSCGDEDDDLFSSNFSSKDNTKNKNIYSSSNNSGNLSSVGNNSSTINKSNKTGIVDDLFADIDVGDDLFSSFGDKKSSESKDNKIKSEDIIAKQPSKPLSLFDDEDDTDIFGSDFLSTKAVSNSKGVESSQVTLPKVQDNKDKPVSSSSVGGTSINKSSKKGSGLFDDDDIDLFGETGTGSAGDLFSSEIFSKKPTSVPKTLTNDNKKSVTKKVAESDNLFSDVEEPSNVSTISNSGKNVNESSKNNTRSSDLLRNESENVLRREKNKPPESSLSNKNIKTANVKSISLFSSDMNDDFTDDDLFNTNNQVPSKIIPDALSDGIQEKEEINKQSSNLSSSADLDDEFLNKNIPSSAIESENLFSGSNSSNDKLFAENENSKITLPGNTAPPILENVEDDSPLFSDGKNNSVPFSTKDCNNDSVFGNPANSSDNNIMVKTDSKTLSNSELNSDTKQTDSNDLFSEKTDKSTLVSSAGKVSNESLFREPNDPNNADKHNASVGENVSNVNSSKNLFNTNQSLPSVPVKKPSIPVKPSKPEPPKSLNIRAPIALPDPFGTKNNKETSPKTSSDVLDGCTFSSEASSTLPSPRITPGKINLDKSLNINPMALLPGARPTSFKKSSSPPAVKEDQTSQSPKEFFSSDLPGGNISKLNCDQKNNDFISGSSSSLPNTDSEPVLHSIAKDRAKIQVKRRPQTRKARREAVRQSTIENNYEDDETDNSSSITTQSNKEPQSTSSSIFDQPSNILSPSTDEEDLFGVPPLDLPPDYSKVSISPGDIFDAPNIIASNLNTTGISNDKLGNETSINQAIDHLNTNDHKSNDQDSLFNGNSMEDSAKLLVDTISNKENSDIFNEITDDDKNAFLSNVDKNVRNKGKNSVETDNLFSDIDDSDIFSSKSSALKQNLDNNDSDLFSTKSEKSKGVLDNGASTIVNNVSDLFQNERDELEVNAEDTVNSAAISTKSNSLKESINAGGNSDLDLFSSSSKESSNNITVSNDLKKGDTSNIICGVFNTGVVNICDKLSITPPNNDELFPPSDWTLNSKTDNTVVSVPEKIKPESLFTDNDMGSNNIDDDHLFISSNSSSSSLKENLNVRKVNDSNKNKTKVVSDLFGSDDDDEGDSNLFGNIKTNTLVHSKPLARVSQKSELSSSETKKSSVKTKSLFGDEEDEDDGDIFGFPDKSKSVSNTKNLNLSNDSLKHTNNSNSGATKKSSCVTKPKKLTPATTKQEDFIDPLAALGNKDQ